jgi:hypothetical protein
LDGEVGLQHRGQWVIAAVFALGVAASVLAVWYLSSQSRQALEFWGPEAGRLIVQAKEAELLHLLPEPVEELDAAVPEGAESIELGDRRYSVLERRDAIATRGFLHIRRGLMTDAAFDWSQPPLNHPPRWEYAVRFVDGDQLATLVFSFDPPRAALAGGKRTVSIAPVGEAMESFFREAFHEAER